MTESAHPGSRWNAGREPAVGVRVMVRRHLRDGQTSHLYTDVLGHVVALDPELVVRRASGEEVRIPDADVAVLKVLPARPVRARDIRSLGYAVALGWPGTDYALVDGWLCRAGDDWSYRAGAAVPVLPWASDGELGKVRRWYSERGLGLRIEAPERIVDPGRLRCAGEPVDPARLLPGRGMHLCTGSVEALAAGAPAEDAARVELAADCADDWTRLYHGTAHLDPARVRPALSASAGLDASGDPVPRGDVRFARLEVDGRLAAITRGVVTTAADGVARLGISCVETAPDFQRRGLAEVVTAAVARWGAGLGAREAYLHVFADNAAGSALWTKLGLQPHHELRHVEIT